MYFRTQGDKVQALKTTEDGGKTKTRMVASINLATRAISLKADSALDEADRDEIDRWIERQIVMRRQREHLAVQELPELIRRAAVWLIDNEGDPDTIRLMEDVRFALKDLNRVAAKVGA